MLNYSDAFAVLADPTGETLPHFYQAFLGQAPIVQIPSIYAEFQLAGLRLGIFTPKADRQSEFAGQPGGMSLCLEVENLEQAIDRLTQLGHPPPGEIISASHGREIYTYDPLGNRMILHQKHSR